ncbi:MAG: response regulator [Planctomycetes bacterium]|nr:response regulator [Planctomycetota bacterium]
MAALDTNLLLLGTSSIVWAGAGAGCLRGPGDGDRRLLGVGMLVGAAAQCVDGLTTPGAGLPLAGLALAVFVGLATLGVAVRGMTAATVAASTLFLLHWAHAASPHQAVLSWQWLGAWRPLDLTVAVALAWITRRGRQRGSLSTDAQLLAGATAGGLALAAFGGRFAEALAVGGMLVGALPLLFAAARRETVSWCASTAVALAVTLTATLRAVALQRGHSPQLAGLDDPLLVLAVMQIALGAALWFAYAPAASATANADEPIAPRATAAPGLAPHDAVEPHTVPATVEASPHAAVGLVPTTIVRELRTPLTNLVAAVDLAITDQDRRALDNLTDQLQTYAQQMTTAIADIGELEHLLRGELELAEDVFDLPQLLHNCLTEVTPTAEQNDLTVRLDVASTTPRWVQSDPARVRQLLTRTMQLALHAARIGPLDISVSADADTLHVVLLNQHASNAAPDGLGTLFVTELARAMGGKLEHQLRTSSGSQLHLSLPKQIAPEWEVELIEQDAEASLPRAEPAAGVHGTVLLITDNADHRKLLARMLGRFGAEVVTADSGLLGRHLMSDTHYDLVLLDMQIHGEDPLTIVRGIRADGGETPMLAVSSDCSAGELERILAAGCNGHLAKPVDGDLLRRALMLHLAPAN